MAKLVSGTKEWAEESYNFCMGCSHGCLYCYARSRAARFNQSTATGWTTERVNLAKVRQRQRQARGTVMCPSTHDITPAILPQALEVLGHLLDAGNRLLIVSKPHLECVRAITTAFPLFREQILFRFSIGAMSDAVLSFWEPGAPAFAERLSSLRHAHESGFETSVSMEPLLEYRRAIETIDALRPFVSHSIWIGKANQLRARTSWVLKPDDPHILEIEHYQSDEYVRSLYERLQNDPRIRWKESYKQVVGLAGVTRPGEDR